MWITSSLPTAHVPTDIALGNFDGVHLGHQTVIRPILPASFCDNDSGLAGDASLRQMWDVSALQGYSDRCVQLLTPCHAESTSPPVQNQPSHSIPTVVTFYPHPREFFSGQVRPWLTPLAEKAAFMRYLGVQQLVLLPFNQELAHLSSHDFVEEILFKRLQARHLSVGADFRFGHGRSGDATLLERLAVQRDIQVSVVDLARDEGDRISSSQIRQALCTGDVVQAQGLLGRPYQLSGRVILGQQLGRQLGFPTANLQVPADKFLPRTGVYSVQVYGIPQLSPHQALPGVMNIGVRPTVNGQKQTIEVHLLNWTGDLYDTTLIVALKGFLRPEQRFDSLEHLKAQIQADCEAAQAVL
ncbi:MAG: bifunctional riboflavin kinase/FAD synthetase [Cyanobacteria bacterium P01_H01_bin.58]